MLKGSSNVCWCDWDPTRLGGSMFGITTFLKQAPHSVPGGMRGVINRYYKWIRKHLSAALCIHKIWLRLARSRQGAHAKWLLQPASSCFWFAKICMYPFQHNNKIPETINLFALQSLHFSSYFAWKPQRDVCVCDRRRCALEMIVYIMKSATVAGCKSFNCHLFYGCVWQRANAKMDSQTRAHTRKQQIDNLNWI